MVEINKRAVSPEQKALRRQQILEAAGYMFASERYETVNLTDLAEKVGITKPALYRYFRGKEVLFLALYENEVEKLGRDFASVGKPENIAMQAAKIFDDRPLFCRLSAILHTVLERDLTYDEALEFKLRMKMSFSNMITVLAGWIGNNDSEKLGMLMMQMHQAMIGAWHMTHPSGTMAEVLKRDEMAPFRMNFRETLEKHFSVLVKAQ